MKAKAHCSRARGIPYKNLVLCLFLIGLAACAPSSPLSGEGSGSEVEGVGSHAPMQTVAPTFTPTPDFLQLDRIPGLDPLTFAGQEEATTGETYSLPEDIFSAARERQLAPIEADGVASRCVNNSCTVMLTDVLVSGAKLQPATDGKVPYGFDGEIGSEALFRFDGLPEGVRATAFVAQEGNPWGLLPGTVVVWFWEGGSKGPATILNPDNPLQIMADKPNSISLTAIDNGLRITRTGPDGVLIDEQTVSFLPPLPSEFLAKYPNGGYEIVEGKVMVNGEVWFEMNSAGEWQDKRPLYWQCGPQIYLNNTRTVVEEARILPTGLQSQGEFTNLTYLREVSARTCLTKVNNVPDPLFPDAAIRGKVIFFDLDGKAHEYSIMMGAVDNSGREMGLDIGVVIPDGVMYRSVPIKEALQMLEDFYNDSDDKASRQIDIDFATEDRGAPWILGEYINPNRELLVQLIEALKTGRGFPENVPEDFFLWVSQVAPIG